MSIFITNTIKTIALSAVLATTSVSADKVVINGKVIDQKTATVVHDGTKAAPFSKPELKALLHDLRDLYSDTKYIDYEAIIFPYLREGPFAKAKISDYSTLVEELYSKSSTNSEYAMRVAVIKALITARKVLLRTKSAAAANEYFTLLNNIRREVAIKKRQESKVFSFKGMGKGTKPKSSKAKNKKVTTKNNKSTTKGDS